MTENENSIFRRIINLLTPPSDWQLPVILLLGIFFGIALMIFKVSNALSYLSDDPAACANCHVMHPQFATWQNSSHGRVTNCNDCHVPHNNIIEKYYFKATDGLRHATMFTLRMEPQVIQIKEAGKNAVQQNCIRCHSDNIHPVSVRAITASMILNQEERFCWDCHREVPHGRVNSLTSAPYARTPQLEPVIPEWIENKINKSK